MFLLRCPTRVFMSVPKVLLINMAQSFRSMSYSTNCQRLINVTGTEGKQNDVIVCGPKDGRLSKQHILFFGGDVQDYRENMESHYTNKNYVEWNLESTAQLLQSRFQDSTVIVVKPSKMLFKTFSIYENFLSFDEDGLPEFNCDSGALLHLTRLYNMVVNKLSNDSNASGIDYHDGDVTVKVVGFSKGCVVLTKLMFELSIYKSNPTVQEFLKKVSAFYWLDGGHNGRRNAYITNDAVLQEIKNLNKELFVLVTPYQIQCTNRKWIGREERQFVFKLEALNAKIKEYRYFMDVPASIENHFQVLTKVA